MPLVIKRPGFPPENVLHHIQVDTDNLCAELAKAAQQSLQAHTPNRWKGYLYRAVSVIAKIPDGYGVGGPVGPGEVLPTMESAPRGTIANFLKEHPEYRAPNNEYIPRGMAWWHLPQDGKEKLKEERMAGKFGGKPPRAPYWLIAEYGSTAGISSTDVGVRAINYIEKSRAEVDAREKQLVAALKVTP